MYLKDIRYGRSVCENVLDFGLTGGGLLARIMAKEVGRKEGE